MTAARRFAPVPALRPEWERLQKTAPVFVTAPVERCGSTLVQRLLNSSRQIAVYGENPHFCEIAPATLYGIAQAARPDRPGAALMEAARERVRSGDTEFWTNSFLPPTAAYAEIMLDAFYRAAAHYEADAAALGFDRWGVKYPLGSLEAMRAWLAFLPGSRIVVIRRDIVGCVASAKARRFFTARSPLLAFCERWVRNLDWLDRLQGDEVHVMCYEALVESPAAEIDRLGRFLGIEGMDLAVMTRRINRFASSAASDDGAYVEPAPLAPEELAVVDRVAGACRRRLGYA